MRISTLDLRPGDVVLWEDLRDTVVEIRPYDVSSLEIVCDRETKGYRGKRRTFFRAGIHSFQDVERRR